MRQRPGRSPTQRLVIEAVRQLGTATARQVVGLIGAQISIPRALKCGRAVARNYKKSNQGSLKAHSLNDLAALGRAEIVKNVLVVLEKYGILQRLSPGVYCLPQSKAVPHGSTLSPLTQETTDG